ncbi:MAG: YlxR family protein [Muribaculaceae bacterium]|nr:YlxR family protein [Roseburia sp.]MCM1431006.1 YlxR family protein [Muribaculaceae bacterium]MCM1493760.1 YlxR family protein [Muribaculaceae bacterium]
MKSKRIPMRQCVGCREMKAKKDLIRVVRIDEAILLDATGKKNGRGAYICPDPECLRLAKKSKGLERSLAAELPAEVYGELEKELSTIAT